MPLPLEKPRWNEVTPVSGSSVNSSTSASVPGSSEGPAAAAEADRFSGVGICSGSCTVSLEDRLALLDDEVGESGASVTGDWRSRPSVEGEGTMDPSLLPGLVGESGRARFSALWSLRYDSRTVAHQVAIDIPDGLRRRTNSSSALAPASGTGTRASSPPGTRSNSELHLAE